MNLSVASHEHDSTAHHDDVWYESFTPDDRREQLHEDAVAWRNVTGLLFGVVAIGLIIALMAVWISGKIPLDVSR